MLTILETACLSWLVRHSHHVGSSYVGRFAIALDIYKSLERNTHPMPFQELSLWLTSLVWLDIEPQIRTRPWLTKSKSWINFNRVVTFLKYILNQNINSSVWWIFSLAACIALVTNSSIVLPFVRKDIYEFTYTKTFILYLVWNKLSER